MCHCQKEVHIHTKLGCVFLAEVQPPCGYKLRNFFIYFFFG